MQKVYWSLPVFASLFVTFDVSASEANLPTEVVLDKDSAYYNQVEDKIIYTNENVIEASPGGNTVLVNAKSAPVDITNKGEINSSATGFGIYGFTNPTVGNAVYIDNQGTIERIQLQEVDSVTIFNQKEKTTESDEENTDTATGEQTTPDESAVPTVRGSVLLGTNAEVSNFGGKFENLEGDVNDNTIAFAAGGAFHNGAQAVVKPFIGEDGNGTLEIVGLNIFDSTLSVDNIIFTSDGFLSNGSVVDVKNITMGTGATIRNIVDPYISEQNGESVAGQILKKGASIKAQNIVVGDESTISNEMGAKFEANKVVLGKNSVITNGDDYYFNYANTVDVTTVSMSDATDGILGGLTTTTTSFTVPNIPHASEMKIESLSLGEGSSFVNNGNSTYTGTRIDFVDNGTLNITSGFVNVQDDITFLDNGVLSLSSALQLPVYVPRLINDEETGDENTETAQAYRIMTLLDTDVEPLPDDEGRLSDAEIDLIIQALRDSDASLTEADLRNVEIALKNSAPADPNGKFTIEELESIINTALSGSGAGSGGSGSSGSGSGSSGGSSSGGGSSGSGSGGSGSGSGLGQNTSGMPEVPENLKDLVEYVEVLPKTIYTGALDAKNIIMGNNAIVNITGGKINTGKMQFGDNANMTVSTAAFSLAEGGATDGSGSDLSEGDMAYFVFPLIKATEGIYFGNSSTLTFMDNMEEDKITSIYTPSINFLNDGKLGVFGGFTLYSDSTKTALGEVNMAERGYIETAAALKAKITLGSDSNVLLTDGVDEDEPLPEYCDHCIQAGTILGSLQKASGASNVNVTVNVEKPFFAKLDGDINVDNILVDMGLLEAAGEVKGNIYLNTDTTFRVTSSSIKDGPLIIHDPINRLDDTTNTSLEVLMDANSGEFYKTTNTINVENLKIYSGGIEINNPVNIDNVLLDSDTTIRLTDNFKIGSVREFEDDRSNTTLEIDAKGKSVNSSGEVYVDRILVSSGNYNAFHEINISPSSGPATYPTYYEEGVELGTDASLTAYADVAVSRVVRDQKKMAENESVTNTTLNVNSNHFKVRGNVDVDNLNMNGGVFEFLNDLGTNAVNVTNDIHLKPYAALAGSGILNIKTGKLSIDKNSRLAVSTQSVAEKPLSELKILSSDKTIINSASHNNEDNKALVVETDSTGYIDVRASNDKSDKIIVDGTVNLADGTRIIVRDIKAGQEYEILSATQLNGNSDKLRTTFLWKGTDISITDNKLSLKISGLQTLKAGIAATKHSKNVDSLVDLLNDLRQSVGSYTIDPFIDNVYFAQSADDAVSILDEYSPEGYLNTQQATLRLQKVFKESVLSEMNAMRNYRVKHDFARGYYVKNPYYYGRPGYERYYYGFKQIRSNPYGQRRSDRGGMWAKPFALAFSQDDKDNQSGYDFDAQGFVAGIDRKVGVFSLGLAAMYATGDMEQKNKKFQSEMTTYGLGIYASITPHYSRSFMDFYALWSQSSNSTNRKITSLAETAKADFDVSAYTIGADIGYELMLTPNFVITPKIGLDYTSVEMDEVLEKGHGRALASVKGTNLTSIQTPVELKAALDFGNPFYRFKPEAHVRWTHEFGDVASKSMANFTKYAVPFAVEGLNADRDTFTVGGSLLWLYGLSELELKYDYDFSSTSTGHTINMGYKYLF